MRFSMRIDWLVCCRVACGVAVGPALPRAQGVSSRCARGRRTRPHGRGRQAAAARIRWRSIPTWRFGRWSCSRCCLRSSRSSPGRRLPRRWTSASGTSRRRLPRPRPSSRRPSAFWPSTKRSWRPRRAKFAKCSKKPAAMPKCTSERIEEDGRKAAGRGSRPGDRARSSGRRTARCKSWRSPVPTWRSSWVNGWSATNCRFRRSIKARIVREALDKLAARSKSELVDWPPRSSQMSRE